MKKRLILLTTLLLSSASAQCLAESRLHITTGFTPPVSNFYKSVLAEADKRMDNISISFEILPAERSLVLVNQGINDGECCRIASIITNQYDNLIPVNESFFTARFSVFSKNTHRSIKSFEDLKPFSVGSVTGWKIAVNKVKEAQPVEIHILDSPAQLFQMINQDRLDYGVLGYLSGLKSISDLKFNSIHALDPPLIEKPLHLLLHKKHKKLLPELNKTITEMKNDGTIARLYNELTSH